MQVMALAAQILARVYKNHASPVAGAWAGILARRIVGPEASQRQLALDVVRRSDGAGRA